MLEHWSHAWDESLENLQQLPSPGPAKERKPGPMRGAKTHGGGDRTGAALEKSLRRLEWWSTVNSMLLVLVLLLLFHKC